LNDTRFLCQTTLTELQQHKHVPFKKDQPDLLLEILLNHEQIFEAVVSALSGIKPLKRQDPLAQILHLCPQ
jgi:hypothetical protein